VTVGEANVVLDRVDAAIRKTLALPAARATTDRSDKAVTRAQILARLDAMFESYRPKFHYTPRPSRADASAASKSNKDPKTLATIAKLSRFGCVGPVGRLVVGPADTLSVADFGEAVGYFMAQIAALTYTADPKWVPALMPDGGQ
jgi:hypothetical protein